MSNEVRALLDQILGLPSRDRAALAAAVLDSLSEDAGYDAEWKAEVRRRLDEIEVGTARTISSEELFAELKRELG